LCRATAFAISSGESLLGLLECSTSVATFELVSILVDDFYDAVEWGEGPELEVASPATGLEIAAINVEAVLEDGT
jgi:hypothetical protein